MGKTIDQGFSEFLRDLQPLTSEHNKVTAHRSSVHGCLTSNFDCSAFIETGSFGNGTGIRHYSDTDYFAVIPAGQLKTNSAISLREVKEALIKRFPNTMGLAVKTPAVSIPFGYWASETMEVTPACFAGFKEYDSKKFKNYEIADGEGGWMYSSPEAHNYYVQQVDNALGGKVKPLVRLMKAWKYYNNVPISSFFLELYTTRYCAKEPAVVYSIDLQNLFNNLLRNELPGMNDPVGISGRIKPCSSDARHEEALSKVKTAAGRADRAGAALANSKVQEAFEIYDYLFGQNFPGFL